MAIEGVVNATLPALPVLPKAAAAPIAADVSRFQNAMAAGPSVDAAAVNAAPQMPAPTRTGTLGDTILNTLESSSTQVRNAWAKAGQTLSRTDVNMSDMLKLQVTVLQASVTYDLVSKGISKANQSLDQMLRTQ